MYTIEPTTHPQKGYSTRTTDTQVVQLE